MRMFPRFYSKMAFALIFVFGIIFASSASSLYITVESAQVTIPVSNIKAAELPQEVVDDLAKIALSETSKTEK